MIEYIDREAALEIVKRTSGDYAAAFAEIRKLPAADVVPVVRGEWVKEEDSYYVDGYIAYYDFHCSICGETVVDRHGLPNYCPWCGAKM